MSVNGKLHLQVTAKRPYLGCSRCFVFSACPGSNSLSMAGRFKSSMDKLGTGCSSMTCPAPARCVSATRSSPAWRLLEPRRTNTPCSGPGLLRWCWRELPEKTSATSNVRRVTFTSSTLGTRRGEIPLAIKSQRRPASSCGLAPTSVLPSGRVSSWSILAFVKVRPDYALIVLGPAASLPRVSTMTCACCCSSA